MCNHSSGKTIGQHLFLEGNGPGETIAIGMACTKLKAAAGVSHKGSR